MPSPKTRKEALTEIIETLKQNNGKISFDELYLKFAFRGLTKYKIKDYIETLQLANLINYDETTKTITLKGNINE